MNSIRYLESDTKFNYDETMTSFILIVNFVGKLENNDVLLKANHIPSKYRTGNNHIFLLSDTKTWRKLSSSSIKEQFQEVRPPSKCIFHGLISGTWGYSILKLHGEGTTFGL